MEFDHEQSNVQNVSIKEHEYALNSLDLGSVLRSELSGMIEDDSCYKGYMEGGQEACNSLLKRLKYLGYRFSVRNSITKQIENKNNTRLLFTNSRNKINIEMFGPPFCVTKYYNMVCVKGHPRINKLKKEESSNGKVKKKIGCPAELHIKIIKYFPKYALNKDAKLSEKLKVMSHLKSNISNSNFVIEYCERLYVNLSKETVHKHQPIFTTNSVKKAISNRHNTQKLESDNNINTNDDLSLKLLKLLEKQSQLKSLAEDIGTISNTILDEELLDRGIGQMSELLDQMTKPFQNAIILKI